MGEVQLLVDIEVLISEDLRPSCSGDTEVQGLDDHLQTTPLSATSSDLVAQSVWIPWVEKPQEGLTTHPFVRLIADAD
jgi:hypothetical protein